jgi:hypothetical protein
VGLVATGPIVHVAKGEGGHAAWSFGLRLTLPIAAGALGYAAALSMSDCAGEHEEEQCRLSEGAVGALVGAGLGTAGALAIDYALHSRRTPPDRAGWAPMITARDNSATLGVAGRF